MWKQKAMNKRNDQFFFFAKMGLAVLAISLIVQVSTLNRAERINRKAVIKAATAPEESARLFAKAHRLDPSNPVYMFNLELQSIGAQETVSANELAAGETVTFPDTVLLAFDKLPTLEPVFLLNQALIEGLSGNWEAGLLRLEPIVRRSFCWTPIRLVYGLGQEAAGNRNLAQKAYIQAIVQSPVTLDSPFFNELSERDSTLARDAKWGALTEARSKLEETPTPLSRALLGEMEYYAGHREAAGQLLSDALAEQPSMNRPWLFLGRIAEEDGDIEKAAEYYEKASLLDREDALVAYFKIRNKGSAPIRIEQMPEMMANPQRIGLRARYRSRVLTPYLIVPDLEMYCTYDYLGKIQNHQHQENLRIQEDLRTKICGKESLPVSALASEVATFFVDTPCEAGLFDIYPEKLRIRLDRTDPLHFVEMCLALATTIKNEPNSSPVSFQEAYSQLICELRYRNGIAKKYSDRIYYFSEWAAQAQTLGLLDELSGLYGKEYQQRFSYLSDHLIYLPQIGNEPQAKEEVLEIERSLNAGGPYYRIESEAIDSKWITVIQEGDIIAFVSDRKGEDVSKLAIIHKEGSDIKLIQASLQEKRIKKLDFPSPEEMTNGIRLFRIR